MENQTNYIDLTGDSQLGTLLNEVYSEVSAVNDMILPDEMVASAVHRACTFFGLPDAPTINADGTCVWPNNPGDYKDDVFGFNRQELMSIGINGEDSLALIYTHECAHRALQNNSNLNSWEEELACDFFAGLHAGLNHIDVSNFEAALGETPGGESHPAGALRAIFIEEGVRVAEKMASTHDEVTFGNCMDSFMSFLEEKGNLVSEYMEHDVPNDSSVMHLQEGEAKHLWIDDRDWHMKEAQNADHEAEYHEREASRAAGRGDYSKAKDHERSAQSYRQKAADHRRSASQCTK